MLLQSENSERGASGFWFSEHVDDAIDQLGELFQRFEDGLTWKRRVFAERYLEGSVKVLTDLDVIHRGQRHHYHAILERADMEVINRRYGALLPGDLKVLNAGVIGHGDECYVFVGNVEIVNSSQRLVPSFVRLKRANYLDDIFSGSVYVSTLNGTLKAVDILREGEVNVFGALSVESDEIAGKQVKGGAKIVNRVADDSSEFLRHLLPDPQLPEVLRGVRVLLDNDSIRISADVRDDFVVQVTDVALGPLNL